VTAKGARRGDIERIALLQDLERQGKLKYLRMIPPNKAAGVPRQFVVDYGRGETIVLSENLFGWVEGFVAGLSAERAEVPLVQQLEDMEQPALRKLSSAVNAELKRRRS